MSNQLVELEDQFLVEVELPPDQVRQISGGIPEKVDKTIDSVRPLLLKVCHPLTAVWSELNKEMSITSAEVELQLGFSAEGSVFLAKANGSANLKIKLSISPKADKP
ncbi:CU044_2847 family protein [Candidatus Electronema sp. JM]|uniref:CU044_2847 family protein n=1 Tax=Candidatus Electronema sp. JM TaxID=3401571 RepID=UPI003AA7C218